MHLKVSQSNEITRGIIAPLVMLHLNRIEKSKQSNQPSSS